MRYEFYCYNRCSTCAKAKKQLDNNHINYNLVEIDKTTPKASDFKRWINEQGYDIKQFFNTSGLRYRELNLKNKLTELSLDEKIALLTKDGMLVKRPLLVEQGKLIQVGYRKPYDL